MSYQILEGDVRARLAEMPSGSVNCCVTSPPYWGLRDYKLEPLVWDGEPGCEHQWVTETIERENRTGLGLRDSPASTRGGGHKIATVGWQRFERGVCSLCGAWRGSLGLEPTPELYVQHLVEIFREARRVLRPDGTLWLNLGNSYASQSGPEPKQSKWQVDGASNAQNAGKSRGNLKPKDLVGIPWMVAFALRADGWWLRSDIIWHKPNPMPESVADRPTKAHENVFLLVKSDKYYCDMKSIEEPIGTAPNAQSRGPKDTPLERGPRESGNTGMHNTAMQIRDGTKTTRNRRSVWTIATAPYKGAHFATFPPKLIEPCVLAGCPPGGVVLDPFVGSGTTCLVAERLGRNSIGIELNPDYVRMAHARMASPSKPCTPGVNIVPDGQCIALPPDEPGPHHSDAWLTALGAEDAIVESAIEAVRPVSWEYLP